MDTFFLFGVFPIHFLAGNRAQLANRPGDVDHQALFVMSRLFSSDSGGMRRSPYYLFLVALFCFNELLRILTKN